MQKLKRGWGRDVIRNFGSCCTLYFLPSCKLTYVGRKDNKPSMLERLEQILQPYIAESWQGHSLDLVDFSSKTIITFPIAFLSLMAEKARLACKDNNLLLSPVNINVAQSGKTMWQVTHTSRYKNINFSNNRFC